MAKMTPLGFKRKELYGSPSSCEPSKDYENETVYPEVNVDGPMAEAMGAEELSEGDVVEVPVVLKVKRHVKTTADGKTSYSMTLCMEKMGDMTVSEGEAEADDSEDESESDEDYGGEMMAVLGVDK